MSHLRSMTSRSFANSDYPLWVRLADEKRHHTTILDSISVSDHYPDGTCIGIPFYNCYQNAPFFRHAKNIYNLHIPLPFKTVLSACKDFRSVALFSDDELNLTCANIPLIRAFYEDKEKCGNASVEESHRLLVLQLP